MTTTLSYKIAPITKFHITETEEKKGHERGHVTAMEIDGQTVRPTPRFWLSLCANFSSEGLTPKLFNLFSHAEVFEQLAGFVKKSKLRYALEDRGGDVPNLLAVSNPKKPLVRFDQYNDILDDFDSHGVYHDGMVRSTHTPVHMDNFKIGPDDFKYNFVLDTPVDGYGQPSIYLSLLRYVCSNGAIGYAPAFKSQIKLGKQGNVTPAIRRALEGYSNEEGFAALRDRWTMASKSWASLGECTKVYGTVHKMLQRGMMLQQPEGDAPGVEFNAKRYEADHRLSNVGRSYLGSDGAELISVKLLHAYEGMTGDVCSKFGLVHVDAVSRKQMAHMPVNATMYDLLNYTSEVATHYAQPQHANLLHAEIGNLLGETYDLEGTLNAKPDFQDWFVENENKN